MSDPSTNGALTLRVEDFGPIARAEVDLRPLTVFVGPSNTGKSYLAILIYAFHRFFGGHAGFGLPTFHREYPIFRLGDNRTLSPAVVDALDTMTRLAKDTGPSGLISLSLPAPLADVIRAEINECGNMLSDEILRCFGFDTASSLVRTGEVRTRIVFERHSDGVHTPLEHSLTLATDEVDLVTTVPEAEPMRPANSDVASYLIGEVRDHLRQLRNTTRNALEETHFLLVRSLATLGKLVLPHIVGPLHRHAYYLPAGRTDVMQAHRFVVSGLIGNTAKVGPHSASPTFSGVLADFFEQVVNVGMHRQDGQLSDGVSETIPADIEDVILGGSVRVYRSPLISYPEFTYRPEGWDRDLPMKNASSMVSELAPVVLYLRYVIHPGDVLIVEEPEAHLHPAMQVEFIRQIASLVSAGVRVIVTTHSEFVMEELANIVRRSDLSLSEDEVNDGAVALDPDSVGAWLFRAEEESEGTFVKEMELDREVGLYPTDFDSVSEDLYNDNVGIFNRLARENGE